MPTIQTPLEVGTRFLEAIWFNMASRVVEAAITTYNVSEERAEQIRDKYLKIGDYVIQPK